eukprot:1146134-Pelagomonas_calceolata.AAC.2
MTGGGTYLLASQHNHSRTQGGQVSPGVSLTDKSKPNPDTASQVRRHSQMRSLRGFKGHRNFQMMGHSKASLFALCSSLPRPTNGP